MQNREFENNIKTESDEEALVIEGRNAVLEAFRSGKTIDKLYVLDGCRDGIVNSIVREAKKQDTVINYLSKEKLNQMSQAGKHQGVIAHAAAYKYAEIEDMFALAEGGRTFGSVSTKEISEAAKKQLNLDIEKKKLVLPNPIRNLGVTNVPVKLHPKVTGSLKVWVKEEA